MVFFVVQCACAARLRGEEEVKRKTLLTLSPRLEKDPPGFGRNGGVSQGKVDSAKGGWRDIINLNATEPFIREISAAVLGHAGAAGMVTTISKILSVRYEGLAGGTLFQVAASLSRRPLCKPRMMCAQYIQEVPAQSWLFFQAAKKKEFTLVASQLGWSQIPQFSDATAEATPIMEALLMPNAQISGLPRLAAGSTITCPILVYAQSQPVTITDGQTGNIFMLEIQVTEKRTMRTPDLGVRTVSSCSVREYGVLRYNPAPGVGRSSPYELISSSIKMNDKCTPCDVKPPAQVPVSTPTLKPSGAKITSLPTSRGTGCKENNLMCMMGTTPKCEDGAWRCQSTFLSLSPPSLSPTKTPSAPPTLRPSGTRGITTSSSQPTTPGTGSAGSGCKALNLMCMMGTTPKCEDGAWRCQSTFLSPPSLSPTKQPSTAIANSKAPTKTK